MTSYYSNDNFNCEYNNFECSYNENNQQTFYHDFNKPKSHFEIRDLPIELQNKIFYFLKNPFAEAIEQKICKDCSKVRRYDHKCDYCDKSICFNCKNYEYINYKPRKVLDEIMCHTCIERG